MTWVKVHDIPELHAKMGITITSNDDYLSTQSWINLETGAKVHVVNAGGWRHPEDSSIRVFHESPTESVVDITTLFGDTSYDTNPEKSGMGSYEEIYNRVVDEVNQLIRTGIAETK
ncbi:hypothetical protein [Rothia sp. L_38]|uniref:hypothetical protein n=1 Tax=Rothia sp. L_38 TaxID=3422315 RepID=UPI003D6C1A48